MADIKNRDGEAGADPRAPREEAVREGIELLFFAYRDFTAEPDAILVQYGFGRAHHRVVHFVGRHPQMTVGELLGILRITKQSLNRVLGQLLRQGFILELTDSGRELERRLSELQRARVAAAYKKAGAPSVEGFRKVLLAIIAAEEDRRRFGRR